MALRARLTKSLLANHYQAMLAAGETLWLVWDSEIAGFGARLVKKGTVFFLNYRHGRTERRMTLGTSPSIETSVRRCSGSGRGMPFTSASV